MEQSDCSGKFRYTQKTFADRRAKELRRDFEEPFHSYHCRFCNAWHVGTQSSQFQRPLPVKLDPFVWAEGIEESA